MYLVKSHVMWISSKKKDEPIQFVFSLCGTNPESLIAMG